MPWLTAAFVRKKILRTTTWTVIISRAPMRMHFYSIEAHMSGCLAKIVCE